MKGYFVCLKFPRDGNKALLPEAWTTLVKGLYVLYLLCVIGTTSLTDSLTGSVHQYYLGHNKT